MTLFVDYEAKNDFGVDLKNTSICYFYSILIGNEYFIFPDIDLMTSIEHFHSSLFDIGKISIVDKISYQIDKNNFLYYEND